MKVHRIGVVVATALALGLTACGSASDPTGEEPPSDGALSVVNVVNGYLGDLGFFDDAQSGIDQLKDDGHKTDTLQADSNNPAQWKANLESVSTGDWGIVVAGTSQMGDVLVEAAPKFPNQHYIYYDGIIDEPNVASITYRQNEGAFLAGVLAAFATTDTASFPLSDGSKKVGVVGGMDIPVVNDFVVGFTAGVEAVDPSIEVIDSYVGSFSDSAKGYDHAKAMLDQGVDVVFQVAGGSGVGVLQAVKDADKYGIGVDSNQNGDQPGHILASMLKHVGPSIVAAVNAAQDGTLEFGGVLEYGLADDSVGLAFENNGDLVPQSVIDQIDAYKANVVSGEIEVPSTEE